MKLFTSLTAIVALGTTQLLADDNFHYDYATVLQSEPVYRMVQVTGQEQRCQQEDVIYRQRSRDSSTNSLIGGIVGAAVGHAIGHRSKHRTGATIAGAMVGATIAGNNDKSYANRYGVEKRCRMVPISWEEERIIGYNVVYHYNGRTFETRLPYEPTDSLKVRVMINPITEAQ